MFRIHLDPEFGICKGFIRTFGRTDGVLSPKKAMMLVRDYAPSALWKPGVPYPGSQLRHLKVIKHYPQIGFKVYSLLG